MAAVELEKLLSFYKNNTMSHAYLIETNNPELCFQDLLIVVKKMCCPHVYSDNCSDCNLCSLIDMDNIPSIKIIYPDGNFIKKEQVLDLKRAFSTMPLYTNNNIYVINYAEKLNSSSANTMLKFVEEPDDNIIGFFICNNRNNVISTIVSRCEIISINYEEKSLTLDKINGDSNLKTIFNTASIYLNKIEVEKNKSILYNKDVLENISDREQLVLLFKIILFIYEESLKQNTTIFDSLPYLQDYSEEQLIERIKLTTKYLDDINYNANRDLFLDRFVIELSDIDG